MKRKFYIDIDGVLLKGKEDGPVENIHELISFAVSNFDCYWLTTHCKGDAQTAIDYLSEYLAEEDIELLREVKPTDWRTLKTEAIDFTSDFYWIDDYVMRAEKEILFANGREDSLILFDDSKSDEVDRVIACLSRRIDTACRIMVIPDVHGRTFWREPVHEALENSLAKVIFLGDYVDTYPYEFDGMDPDVINRRAIGIFKEIIELKKKYPDRMTLLLGNHDCTYAISTSICECRTDYKNFEEIRDLFVADRDLFRLADETTINGRHFIFSHAGINQRYARLCFGSEADESNIVEKFNHTYHLNDLDILMSLGMVSCWRGNLDSEYGSIVWADAREWDGKDNIGFGFGVVGHTQLNKPCVSETLGMAFLDCRKVFMIDDMGKIEYADF